MLRPSSGGQKRLKKQLVFVFGKKSQNHWHSSCCTPLHAASVSFEENTKAGCSSTPTKRVFRKARSWADDGCDRVLLCRWSSRARALHRLISPVADRSSAASSELRFANLSDRLEAGKTLFS